MFVRIDGHLGCVSLALHFQSLPLHHRRVAKSVSMHAALHNPREARVSTVRSLISPVLVLWRVAFHAWLVEGRESHGGLSGDVESGEIAAQGGNVRRTWICSRL